MDYQVNQRTEVPVSKWATARLIIGIICIAIFPLFSFQSCAVSVGNLWNNGEDISGIAGILTAFFLLISGIVMVATRKNTKKGPSITSCAFLWVGFFFSRVLSGDYTDLRIWGMLEFFFGAFFLITAKQSKKWFWIALVISVIYFLLGIA